MSELSSEPTQPVRRLRRRAQRALVLASFAAFACGGPLLLACGCRGCERTPNAVPELPSNAPVAITPPPVPVPPPAAEPARKQRLVAYVNCLCGFGVGASEGACAAEPDPAVNQVKAWEASG